MRRYELIAPAKINLSLRVLGRRADGFHAISSLMVPISLADRLWIEVGGDEVRVEVPGRPALESDSNLCLKAARAFEEALGIPVGLRVVLEKRIPIAGGLGGGSSDAAAVLRCLAHHHGIAFEDPLLREAALAVGSDVPFFLRGSPALAEGRGERLLDPPALPHPLYLLVLQPPFGVSAGEAYGQLAKIRAEAGGSLELLAPLPPTLGSAEEVAGILVNDLEEAVARLHPIGGYAERLVAAGALGALLSGSGSCFFGLFADARAAEAAASSIRRAPDEVITLAHTLQRTPDLRETSRQPGSTPTSF